MKNQSDVNRAASSELQPLIDTASKGSGGKGAATELSTSTATAPADPLNQVGGPGTIVPNGAKGGHDI